MSRKPYRLEEIIAKLREADVLLSQGRRCGEGDRSVRGDLPTAEGRSTAGSRSLR